MVNSLAVHAILILLAGAQVVISQNADQVAVLKIVNDYRQGKGLSAVCLESHLNAAAQAHSQDMASSSNMDHTGSDGSSPFQRMTAAGYNWNSANENIAAGQQTAADVMQAWISDPPHEQNIASPSVTHMGLAVVSGNCPWGSNCKYWTQDFASTSDASVVCLNGGGGGSQPPTSNPGQTVTAPVPSMPVTSTVSSPPVATLNPSPPGNDPSTSDQLGVLKLVNDYRQKKGLKAVCLESHLNAAAQAHSQDMASSSNMDHTGSDGSSPFQRMTAAGYKWRSANENIAAGQQTPADVMQAWISDPPHEQNIASPSVTHMGLAAVAGNCPWGSNCKYWTQDFASTSDSSVVCLGSSGGGAASANSGSMSGGGMQPTTTSSPMLGGTSGAQSTITGTVGGAVGTAQPSSSVPANAGSSGGSQSAKSNGSSTSKVSPAASSTAIRGHPQSPMPTFSSKRIKA